MQQHRFYIGTMAAETLFLQYTICPMQLFGMLAGVLVLSGAYVQGIIIEIIVVLKIPTHAGALRTFCVYTCVHLIPKCVLCS